VALRRRVKSAPTQLGLFEQPPVRRIDCDLDEDCTCGVSAGAPMAMTAVEAALYFHGHEYVGFCMQDGGVICRECLDRDGAVVSLRGRKFFHYLWPGGADFRFAVCDACGKVMQIRPCATRLEPPAA
jgi:hypothetical protein